MKWLKKGLIFTPDTNFPWMRTHAQIPSPYQVDKETLRIFFCSRDNQNRSTPTYIDVDINNPSTIIKINDTPLLNFGKPGTFDDNGIMPTCLIKYNDKLLMHYTGWSPRIKSSYGLAIGIAVSLDNGQTFQKHSNGAVIDRSVIDPIFPAGSCVFFDNGIWRMWYISCTEWKIINGKTEPVYLIKYAESKDGYDWKPTNKICINYQYDGEALGRPWVIKEDGLYKMWYSSRGSINYRMKNGQPYHLGYAESTDGLEWTRLDDQVGITLAESGWDSEMITYCAVYRHNQKKYMLYNGNGFGKAGFGYAVMEE